MTDDLITQLRVAEERCAPTLAERSRILDAVHEHIAQSAAADRCRSPRRRRTGWAIMGTALAGAAGIVALIAYAPIASDPGSKRFTGPLTAASALANASDAAGSADNSPLRADEWFHVYSTSFQPDNSEFEGDPGYQRDGGHFGNTEGFETWLDRDGRGAVFNIRGGGPNVSAHISRDPKTGEVTSMGIGTRPLKSGETVSVEASLEHPVSISVMSWPRSSAPATTRGWFDVGRGKLELAVDRELGEDAGTIPMDAAGNQTQFWSIPITEIDKLTGAGAELDRQIDELIERFLDDSPYRSNRIPTGTYGITAASKDREESIEQVVRMLGMAPLPADARRALFRWLARQSSVQLDGSMQDELGRTGTGVRFETVYDERRPARRVTAAQLVEDARRAGATDIRPVRSSAVYAVPAHRQFRRWSVRLIFDERTGQVLQSQSYSSQTSPGATVPMLMRDQAGNTKVLAQGDQMNSAGAQLFIERGRSKSVRPASPACKVQPEVCEW